MPILSSRRVTNLVMFQLGLNDYLTSDIYMRLNYTNAINQSGIQTVLNWFGLTS